nr:hypothetical protein [Candidatus Omnitrophota bacterium]
MRDTRMNTKKERIESSRDVMRAVFLPAFFLLAFLALHLPVSFANVLGNPSFEEPIGNGSGGNWDSTNGATRLDNAMVTGMGFSDVPDGQYALWIDNGAGQFTFQVKDNVREGQMV